jgi:streptomycin 3"-adenylyltransferase
MKSDIDYIVVVSRTLPADVKNKLIKTTVQINESAPEKGLEMSVVLKEHCLNFKYPAPYELHFSKTHRESTGGVDKDLAAHFTVIKKAGLVLHGEPIDSVFGEILKEYYLDSIMTDAENAKAEIKCNQDSVILNLCRVFAYKRDGLILSKEAGGNWGLKNINAEYGGIIKTALDNYKSSETVIINQNSALEFCDYMLKTIKE